MNSLSQFNGNLPVPAAPQQAYSEVKHRKYVNAVNALSICHLFSHVQTSLDTLFRGLFCTMQVSLPCHPQTFPQNASFCYWHSWMLLLEDSNSFSPHPLPEKTQKDSRCTGEWTTTGVTPLTVGDKIRSDSYLVPEKLCLKSMRISTLTAVAIRRSNLLLYLKIRGEEESNSSLIKAIFRHLQLLHSFSSRSSCLLP